MISTGEKLPDVTLARATPEGPQPVQSGDYFAQGTTVLFAVPGAFTPTCSARHLPGFVDHADDIRAKGADRIACVSVNDAFVMQAWGESAGADDKVDMLADGNGDFARALGLTMDGTKFGMGERSQRYAMIVRDGKVDTLLVEDPGAFEKSSAESVLSQL
jgi:peroxiredoxin